MNYIKFILVLLGILALCFVVNGFVTDTSNMVNDKMLQVAASIE